MPHFKILSDITARFFCKGDEQKARDEELRQSFVRMADIKEMLETRFAIPHMDSPACDTDVLHWCFDSLIKDKMDQKGWNIGLNEKQDPHLCYVFSVLQAQCHSALSFKLITKDLEKDTNYAPALQFIRTHAVDLAETLDDLSALQEHQLEAQHTMVISSKPLFHTDIGTREETPFPKPVNKRLGK